MNSEAQPERFHALEATLPLNCRAAELQGAGVSRWLTPDEFEQVRSAAPKRVKEFAAGRACARLAMRELGHREQSMPMGLDRVPLWPSDVVGSISHTSHYCVALVATSRDALSLGIDCEQLGAVEPSLWSLVCTDKELKWLDSLCESDRAVASTILFSAKEAVFKCYFPLTRKWWEFQDVEIPKIELTRGVGPIQAFHRGNAQDALNGTFLLRGACVVSAIWKLP